MTDRFYSFAFLGCKQQISKSGGSAKQANKENGDAVTDEVSRMIILRKNREICRGFSRLNHNFDWILFTGMGSNGTYFL